MLVMTLQKCKDGITSEMWTFYIIMMHLSSYRHLWHAHWYKVHSIIGFIVGCIALSTNVCFHEKIDSAILSWVDLQVSHCDSMQTTMNYLTHKNLNFDQKQL